MRDITGRPVSAWVGDSRRSGETGVGVAASVHSAQPSRRSHQAPAKVRAKGEVVDASDSEDSPRAGTKPVNSRVSRRSLLRNALAGGAAGLIAVPLHASSTSAKQHAPRTRSAGTKVPQTPPLEKYVDPLPRPMTAIPDPSVYPGADYYDITMREGRWRFQPGFGLATG